jgi:hypothetical protein
MCVEPGNKSLIREMILSEILIQEELHAAATNSFRSRSAAKAKQALINVLAGKLGKIL